MTDAIGSGAGNGRSAILISPGNDGQRPTAPPGDRRLPTVPPSPGSPTPPAPPRRTDTVAVAQVDNVLARHRSFLESLPGVIDVRRGYKVTDGWISTTPCIVVTVKQKRPAAPLQIPDQLDGVLVDVAPATPRQQLLALSPETRRTLTLSSAFGDEEIVRTSRYVPPPHLKLDQVEAAMTVLCHTSPDAGWPTLKSFLSGITQRLTLGMYDFTAPHIRAQLIASMANVRGDLRIVLDPKLALGAPGEGDNPKAGDETEDEVKAEIEKALKKRLHFVWAAVKLEGKTTKGIFPSAYHIKVGVRDGVDFWLSSGNWQSSNQPDLDPLGRDAGDAQILDVYNREWHVVLSHRGLAQLFEQFLEWDLEQAEPLQVEPELAAMPELAMPPRPEVLEVAPRFFSPKTFTATDERPLRVQPLLSPDNYAQHTLELVNSARHSLYIQNQYIKVAKQNAKEFTDILDAVKRAIRDRVDVRIIVRDLPDTRTQLEALQQYGIDLSRVKVLRNTHTKGVIVDSSVVMVGSHNWSNDGVLYNRDASLIFYDADIAKFYEDVFLYDWSRAKQQMSFEMAMPVIVGAQESAPVGYETMRWTDVYDGLS